ncbi:MAG: glucose-6-phosphate dehydrogenase, partial [Synergistales bacterium]|nr:glucose-6-phosphate dehydrogenase [Synergistales bacterium]
MTDLVIFGVTGNLARKKLIPAIFTLEEYGYLPGDMRIIGTGRKPLDQSSFQKNIRDLLQFSRKSCSKNQLERFTNRFSYFQWKDPLESALKLKNTLDSSSLFYLSLPPKFFASTAEALAKAGLNDETMGFRRIVLEKPFGWDEASSVELNSLIHDHWDESQVYRLDHFLGKETVQNILVFRFANMLMEPIWNRNFIRQVQITVFEDIGIESRGQFYDKVGALRDMIQNHLLQIMALTAMEPPARLDPTFLRDEKVKLLRSVRPIGIHENTSTAVRGMYRSYKEEQGIPENSNTETFVAMKLFLDNWRWKGVPFYLRTGKKLKTTITEVSIEFKLPPLSLFDPCMCGSEPFVNNWLVFEIKPEQKISMIMQAKKPGLDLEASSMVLTAPYQRDG